MNTAINLRHTHTDTHRHPTSTHAHSTTPRVHVTCVLHSTRTHCQERESSPGQCPLPTRSRVVTLSPPLSLSFVCVGCVTQRVEHMVFVHFFVASRERMRGLRRQSTHCAPWPAYRVRTRTQKRLCVGDLLPYALAAFVRRGHI